MWTISKLAGKTEKIRTDLDNSHGRRWPGRTNIISWPRIFGMHSKRAESTSEICSNPGFLLEPKKNYRPELQGNLMQKQYLPGPLIWKVTRRNAWKDIAKLQKKTQQLFEVSTPCIDDHHFKEEEMKSVGELPHACSQIVLKCIYLARIGRPDILWSVNKLARSITKWTKACDKRLNRLISFFHHTCEYRQYCHVGNTAEQCRLGLFQDSDFAGDLEDSKSTSGWTLCVFGSHTYVPRSWMCKKETSVSHSSAESEIISLDAGLRLDGITALDLWDLIVAVHGNTTQNRIERGDPLSLTEVKDLKGRPTRWITLIVFPVWSNFHIKKLCCMCLRTTKQWSRRLSREGVPQWDMFPGPTESPLIGYSIGSILDPKIQEVCIVHCGEVWQLHAWLQRREAIAGCTVFRRGRVLRPWQYPWRHRSKLRRSWNRSGCNWRWPLHQTAVQHEEHAPGRDPGRLDIFQSKSCGYKNRFARKSSSWCRSTCCLNWAEIGTKAHIWAPWRRCWGRCHYALERVQKQTLACLTLMDEEHFQPRRRWRRSRRMVRSRRVWWMPWWRRSRWVTPTRERRTLLVKQEWRCATLSVNWAISAE